MRREEREQRYTWDSNTNMESNKYRVPLRFFGNMWWVQIVEIKKTALWERLNLACGDSMSIGLWAGALVLGLFSPLFAGA
jgi:hypothetical protein